MYRASIQNSDFEKWISEYGDYLFRYCVARVNDFHASEDIVQDTFVVAFQSYSDFEGRSSAKTWLTGILRHKIFDHYQKKLKEVPVETLDMVDQDMKKDFDNNGRWKIHPQLWDSDQSQYMEREEFWNKFSFCFVKLI